MSPTKRGGNRRRAKNDASVSATSPATHAGHKSVTTSTMQPSESTTIDRDSASEVGRRQEHEEFLRACFPGMPAARLNSAVDSCNGDIERVMDWLLGDPRDSEDCRTPMPSTMSRRHVARSSIGCMQDGANESVPGSHDECRSVTRSAPCTRADFRSTNGSDRGSSYFTSSVGSEEAASVSTSKSSGATSLESKLCLENAAAPPATPGTRRSGRRKKTLSATVHLDTFLSGGLPPTPEYSQAPLGHSPPFAHLNQLPPTSLEPATSSWTEIERITHHLAVIFPQIARDSIKATLHACNLDLEATIVRLSQSSTSVNKPLVTTSSSRGLSRWDPERATAAATLPTEPTSTRSDSKKKKRKQKATASSTTNTPDEAMQLDTALSRLASVFPEHDTSTLVDALIACQLNEESAVHRLLSGTGASTDTDPRVSSATKGQQHVQQQLDFWTAQRVRRNDHQPSSTASVVAGPRRSKTANTKSKDQQYGGSESVEMEEAAMQDNADICQSAATAMRERRNDSFRRAAQAFRARNRNGMHGAALAAFYAAEASSLTATIDSLQSLGREFNDAMRRWNTRAAVAVLRSFQQQWHREYLVDLHYMTVEQALEVALLAVQDWAAQERKAAHASAVRPLRIITGAGSHSRNGHAKLYPRVQRALREAGWQVSVIDNGSFMVTNPRPKLG